MDIDLEAEAPANPEVDITESQGVQEGKENRNKGNRYKKIDRSKTLFVKGCKEIDINLLEAKLNMQLDKEDKIEKREGLHGEYHILHCKNADEAKSILSKKRGLKGTKIWIDKFKTKLEREIERNRSEFWRLNDVRTPITPENTRRGHELQQHFLALLAKSTKLG